MTWEELKEEIGSEAKEIIEGDRGGSMTGGKVQCFLTDHKSNPMLEWLEDLYKFHCYNCSETYDILDHARWLANDDNGQAHKILCEMAGVEYDEKDVPEIVKPSEKADPLEECPFPSVDPITREQSRDMISYLQSRAISETTAKTYHVTGDSEGVYFNYMVQGSLVKVKGRRIGNIPNGQHKYDLTPKGGTNTLYGQHMLNAQRCLAICEGELDALALHESLWREGMHETILASSIPSGSNSFGWIENSKSFIQQFDYVIIIGDNDDAGRKFQSRAVSELSQFVRIGECDIKKYKANDVNELLLGYGHKQVLDMVLGNKQYQPSFSVDFNSLGYEDEINGFAETGYFYLDKKLYGLQHGFLTVFTGKSGDGKTTVLRQVIDFNARLNCRVGAMLAEESARKFRERFTKQSTAADPKYFNTTIDKWGNKRQSLTKSTVDWFNQRYGNKISLLDNKVLIQDDAVNQLFRWLNYEATIFNTKLFIIDNLMKLEGGGDPKAAWSTQADIVNRLKTFAEALDVHIILVAHPRKDSEIVMSDSIAGSKKIYNLADNVLIFQRLDNISQGNRETLSQVATKGVDYGDITAYIKIDKNRDSGIIDYIPMRYNEQTNLIHDLDPDNGHITGYWTINAREYAPQEDY